MIMYVQTTRITVQCGVSNTANREEDRKRSGWTIWWGEEATQVMRCLIVIDGDGDERGEREKGNGSVLILLFQLLFPSFRPLYISFFQSPLHLDIFYISLIIIISMLFSMNILFSQAVNILIWFNGKFTSFHLILLICTSLHSTLFF